MKDENPFKQKLYNHTLPVSEDMWKHIEASLPAKRKRLPFIWLMAGGFLLMGASIAGIAILNPSSQHITTPVTQPIQEFRNTSAPTEASTSTSIASAEIKTPEFIKEKTTNTTSHKNQSHKTNRNSLKNSLDQSYSATSTETSSGHFVQSTTQRAMNLKATSELEALAINSLFVKDEAIEITSVKPDPSCYRFRGKNGANALSFDVFAGPGVAPRKFESSDSETALYAEARDKTEHGQYAWGAGARINLNLQRGFAVRLGILYDQIGDKFDYRDPSSYMTSTRVDSFFSANGTLLYSDTVNVLVFGTLIKKIHNRYTHLDIPLLLSYELPMGRATLMLNVGPVLNLTSSVRGQILDPNLNPVHLTQGTPDELKAYKNNLGLSLYLGAGALFPLTDNISALIEPRLLYRINPVTLETYPLKEHRSFASLNLGIRYHFN